MRISSRVGRILSLAIAIALPAGGAYAQTIPVIQDRLQIATCRNDWNQAIQLTGSLIASSDISANSRASLLDFRRLLEGVRDQRVAVVASPDCDAVFARYLETLPNLSTPLNWEKAFATLSASSAFNPPDQIAQQMAGFTVAGLDRQAETAIPALSPATTVDTTTGSGVSAGAVSQDYKVFSFVGRQGDTVTVDLRVTRILPGLLYSDDDSQLFLFDGQGQLLANNDDLSRLQSRISNFVLPATGTYYVAVTTYNNDPILDADRRVTGWSGNGGSSVEFTLAVTGVTPMAQLALPQANR